MFCKFVVRASRLPNSMQARRPHHNEMNSRNRADGSRRPPAPVTSPVNQRGGIFTHDRIGSHLMVGLVRLSGLAHACASCRGRGSLILGVTNVAGHSRFKTRFLIRKGMKMSQSQLRQKISTTLATAALTGILAGSASMLAGCQDAGNKAPDAAGVKHACKGQNACKGQGGCKVEGKNACKGQNACKGLGGCSGK